VDFLSKRTIDLKPTQGEMLKPSELIELKGTGKLTLEDRRLFNLLIENAWGPKLADPGAWFEVSTTDLKTDGESNVRLRSSIERLMTTLVRVQLPEGGERRLQLLSTNELVTTSNRGVFRYTFPPKMAELLKDSTIFAKLDLEVMRGFSSKYAFSLYEAISRRLRQRYVFTEELSISELRELLGVEPNKLTAYKSLKARAIDPAVEEVNAIAPFDVTLQPRVSGRKVISYILGWNIKTEGRLRDAYKELHYSRVGRKERLTGASEVIPDNPATS
jgi:hypothetical protein